MSKIDLSRRTLLQSSAAGLALLSTTGLSRLAHAGGLTVGIVYVGPRDDFGWNQAHAVAAAALKEVPGVTVVEEENVPETIAVQKSMESMIKVPASSGFFTLCVKCSRASTRVVFPWSTCAMIAMLRSAIV